MRPATLAMIFVISFVALLTTVNGVAVMSVDLGNEWLKIAIVSPGKPMEVILNTDSARKTPHTVAFRDGERYFGEAALTTGTRFPEKSYAYLLDVIGKKFDSPLVQNYQKRFDYLKLHADPVTGTVVFDHPEGQQYTPEELLAMLLQKSRHYAELAAGDGQTIKDIVITVPPYFSQAERRSIKRSAELAGLKVLQLLNTNTAVALNYGVFRIKDFNETAPSNILFYDMGSTATVATVVSYQIIKSKDRGFTERNPTLTVRGVGYDRTLGGFEMQLRLRDHLVKLFSEQRKISIETIKNNKRAMSKLLKEAARLKRVLSANSEHNAQVENVMDDKDLKAPVSRQEFEDLCADILGDRLQKPVQVALLAAGLTANEIDQVILFGGNTRVPKVQEALSNVLGGKELGKSVNSDEAAALGAAYQAAHLSTGFKVKPFLVKDISLFPIQVDFSREVEQDDGSKKIKRMQRTLFNRNNVVPQKKVLTFSKHTSDFDFYVNYGDVSAFLTPESISYLGSSNITKATVSGIADALAKHTSESEESKGIKAHFRLDESGLLHLEQVEAAFEHKVEEQVSGDESNTVGDAIAKFGSTISKLFSRTVDGEEGTVEEGKANETESQPTPETTANASETKSSTPVNGTAADNSTTPVTNGTAEVRTEIKIKTIKEQLNVDAVVVDISAPAEEEVTKSQKKLDDLNEKDLMRFKLDSIRNSLESFVAETKMKLYETEYESASTEAEREKMTSELNAASEWLEYESDKAEYEEFQTKLTSLKASTQDLFDRVKEHRDRPEALSALNNMLNISSMFLRSAKNLTEDQQIFTEVEISTLEKLVTGTEQWIAESTEEQAKLANSAPPKITIKQIGEKIGLLDREVKYLVNKLKITPPKKKPEPKVEVPKKKKGETEDAKDDENVEAEEGEKEEEGVEGSSDAPIDEQEASASGDKEAEPEIGATPTSNDGGDVEKEEMAPKKKARKAKKTHSEKPEPSKPVVEEPHSEL